MYNYRCLLSSCSYYMEDFYYRSILFDNGDIVQWHTCLHILLDMCGEILWRKGFRRRTGSLNFNSRMIWERARTASSSTVPSDEALLISSVQAVTVKLFRRITFSITSDCTKRNKNKGPRSGVHSLSVCLGLDWRLRRWQANEKFGALRGKRCLTKKWLSDKT